MGCPVPAQGTCWSRAGCSWAPGLPGDRGAGEPELALLLSGDSGRPGHTVPCSAELLVAGAGIRTTDVCVVAAHQHPDGLSRVQRSSCWSCCSVMGVTLLSVCFFPADNTAAVHTQRVGFNRQEQDVYLLPILVVDSGPPPLSSTGTLTIRICGCDSNGAIQSCNSTAYAMSATLSPGALIALLVCVLILIGECRPAPAAPGRPACNPARTRPRCPLTPCRWLTAEWSAGGRAVVGTPALSLLHTQRSGMQPKHSCPCDGWVGAKSQGAICRLPSCAGSRHLAAKGAYVCPSTEAKGGGHGTYSHACNTEMAGSELEQAGRIEMGCTQTRALPRTG